MLVFKVNFLKMLYKCLRIIFNNSEVFYTELKKKRKENYYSGRKINSGHITRKPTAGFVNAWFGWKSQWALSH